MGESINFSLLTSHSYLFFQFFYPGGQGGQLLQCGILHAGLVRPAESASLGFGGDPLISLKSPEMNSVDFKILTLLKCLCGALAPFR